MNIIQADMVDEYRFWNKVQGLKLGSADEHFDDYTLTGEQRAWLRRFAARWEAAENEAMQPTSYTERTTEAG